MKVLNEDIKNKTFKKAYLLFGEEEYLKVNYKRQLVAAITDGNEMNLAKYEGDRIDIQEVIDDADTAPFFAEHKLILIEDSELFKTGGDELAEYLEKSPESSIFVFVETKVDKRTKFYKAVKELGYPCEINKQSEDVLAQWGAQLFAKAEKRIKKADMSYLITIVGTDMDMLSNEIEKLIGYVGEKKTIDKEDIDAVCIKQLSVKIFDMVDAMSVKNQKKALSCYYELIAEREPPMGILYMITRQFNLILQAKDLSARGMGQNEIARVMGVQNFIARKSISQARNFSIKDLKNGLNDSLKVETDFKNGLINENVGVEMLIIKYSE